MGKKKASAASRARAFIENCEVRFRFKCPRQWKELTLTSDDKIRHCGVCEKSVYYCESPAELEECAREGRCAAVDIGPSMELGGLEKLY